MSNDPFTNRNKFVNPYRTRANHMRYDNGTMFKMFGRQHLCQQQNKTNEIHQST